jgi:hypothetical protein
MSVAFKPQASDLPVEAVEQYRVLSSLAVASFVVGLLSSLILFDWLLGIIPMIGIVCGAWALLRIRSRPDELTGEGIALIGTLLSTLFLTGGWSLAAYEYITELPSDKYQRVSYAQLQPPEDDPNQVPPSSAKELDGKLVFVKGYVYPTGQRAGLTHFVLCRDNGTCCFGGKPKLTDMIEVQLQTPLKLDYSPREHKLGGIFRVHTTQSAEGLGSVLYQLEADYVK